MPKILIFFALFLILLFSGLYDILDKEDKSTQDKNEIIQSGTNSANEIKDEVKAAIDSTQKAILDSIRNSNRELIAQGDSNTKAIIESKPKIEYNAIIDLAVFENGKNPKMEYSKNQDSLIFTIYLRNIGNDIACDIEDDFVTMRFTKDSSARFFATPDLHFFNKSTTINPEKAYLYLKIPMGLLSGGNIKNYSGKNYMYVRIKYRNCKDKKQHIFRKIFVFSRGTAEEPDSYIYNLVEKRLKENNLY